MKKIFTVIMAIVLTMALAVAAVAEPAQMGGWNTCSAEENTVTENAVNALEKAQQKLLGAEYTAIAVLGTQLVAGTNYAILCAVTPVVPDAKVASYAVVYVYEALDGECTVTDIQDVTPVSEGVLGGWTVNDGTDTEVYGEAVKALEAAAANLTGASYQAVALTATQLVNGVNYSLICAITPVVPGATAHYAMVTVYANGAECTITEVQDIVLGVTAE